MTENRIYPLKGNNTFYTFLHDDWREIVCKRDYTGKATLTPWRRRIFIEGNTYQYKKALHKETGVDVWVVQSGIHKDPHFFMKSHLSNYFYIEQILREEKLKELGI